MASAEKQSPDRNICGKRIRQARLNYTPRLTQDQLAGKLAASGIQLDRVAITKIETSARYLLDFELRGIAKALKVDANWLLGVSTNAKEGTSAQGRRSGK